jgi:hypothetical protein
VAREVTAAIWTRLFLDLRAARLELEDVLAALHRDRAAVLREEGTLSRQEQVREDVRRAGWCMGVLAAAEGCDLLRARQERDGLGWLVGTVARARSLLLSPPAEHLPSLLACASERGEVTVLAAWCAVRADESGAGVLRWRADRMGGRSRLSFELRDEGVRAELVERCARLAPSPTQAPCPALKRDALELVWS